MMTFACPLTHDFLGLVPNGCFGNFLMGMVTPTWSQFEQLGRIDAVITFTKFEMEVRTCGSTGLTHGAKHLSSFDPLTHLNLNLVEVTVAGSTPVTVADFDEISVIPHRTCSHHPTGQDAFHRRP